ncbi:MAG: hypothetical protein LW832_10300 [Parachlamydia sp.]|nr:hypothetical protein [Parachlamydia sp.]
MNCILRPLTICEVKGAFAPKFNNTLPKGYITRFSVPAQGIRLLPDLEIINDRLNKDFNFLSIVGVINKYHIHQIEDSPNSAFFDILTSISFDNKSKIEDSFGLGGPFPRGLVVDNLVKPKPLLVELDFEIHELNLNDHEYIPKFIFFTASEENSTWSSPLSHYVDNKIEPEFWKARDVQIEKTDILFDEQDLEMFVAPKDVLLFRMKAAAERVFPAKL